eukprot:330446-Pleurochrysis_carterae.AAC.3
MLAVHGRCGCKLGCAMCTVKPRLRAPCCMQAKHRLLVVSACQRLRQHAHSLLEDPFRRH